VTTSTLDPDVKSHKNALGGRNSLKQAKLEMDFGTFGDVRWSVQENPLVELDKSLCSEKSSEQDLNRKSKGLYNY
jgi:hypothetical protein